MSNVVINIAEAKEGLGELISRVAHHNERIIITRRDKEVAALVSIEDLQLLQSLQDQSDLQEATTALKQAREEGMITIEQLKNELG